MLESGSDLTRLLTLIAHELRTPAAVVTGYLRMLIQGRSGELTETQRQAVEGADRSGVRLAELLDEISDLARIEADSTPGAGHMPVALAELLLPLHSTGAAPVTPVVTIHGDVPDVVISADAVRLRRALSALAAAEGCNEEGAAPVVLRCWTEGRRDRLDVLLALGSPEIIREVGPNVRATRLPYDCWRSGLGLALVLATRIIAGHDGAVWTLAVRPGSAVTLVRLPESSSQAA